MNNNNNDNTPERGGGIFSSFFKNNKTQKMTPQQLQEHQQIFSNFASIVKSKLNNPENVQKLDEIYNSSSSSSPSTSMKDEYEAEKKKMTDMNNNGLTKGLAAGVCTFCFLRFGPGVMARYAMRRRAASGGYGSSGGGGGYKLDAPQTQKIRSPFDAPSQQNFNNNQKEYKPSLLLRAIKLTLDITVSVAISIYASAIFTDKQKLLKDASEIPLLPGRSLVSDELCLDFRKEYSMYSKEVWDRQKDDLLMGGIRDFVVNCRKRSRYEDIIRQESGMREEESVSIPSPGVPVDLDVEDMEEESEEEILDGTSSGGSRRNERKQRMVGNEEEDYLDTPYNFESNHNEDDNGQEEHGETWDSINDFEEEDEKEKNDFGNGGAGNNKPRRGWG